ncbi:MAG: ABC-2 transporter permease [Candidatus Onthomonas sp.]|nr:ABC-2 transporter permease [Candidatus Onthomonas sp.]
MKGLLLKDLYTLGKQMKLFLLFILIFAITPGLSLSAFAVMYASMLPMTALAYDERSKWNILASMMPYSATELVLSKYLLGYLMAICAALCSLVAQLVISFFRHTPVDQDALLTLPIFVCIAFLFLAISLPFLFKLGVERGRLIFLVLLAALAVSVVLLTDQLVELLSGFIPSVWTIPICLICAVAVNVFSVLFSVKIYKNSFQ